MHEINKKLQGVRTTLIDMEWRLFKEWQRVIPDEPFEAYAYDSIIKMANKEGYKTELIKPICNV